jgi:hypothetical protein
MGEYFSRAANDLNDVKESINQKLTNDANASLQRVTTSSRQLGFTSLVRGAEELSSVIQLQPNNSMTTQSLLFFLRCELQMIQTEWDFVLTGMPPVNPLRTPKSNMPRCDEYRHGRSLVTSSLSVTHNRLKRSRNMAWSDRGASRHRTVRLNAFRT